MVDQSLVDYIRRYEDHYSLEKIREALIDQGYGRKEVERAIEKAELGEVQGRNREQDKNRGRSKDSWDAPSYTAVIVVAVILAIGIGSGAYIILQQTDGSSEPDINTSQENPGSSTQENGSVSSSGQNKGSNSTGEVEDPEDLSEDTPSIPELP